jgi:hypothetical protein
MNAGIGSLTYLKAALLAAPLRSATDHNTAITALGLGVAARMEQRTNRRFYRTVGDTWVVDAERTAFVLPRYPIESLTSIELRTTPSDYWQSQTLSGVVLHQDDAAGIVILNALLGSHRSQLRFTWTGGWWWDTTEDDTGAQPSGSALVPADLRLAWLTQCKHVWARQDKLGLGHVKGPDANSQLGDMDWAPMAEETLNGYIRHG